MFCSNCGNKLADGAKFCSECGARVATADEQSFRTIADIDFEEPKVSPEVEEPREEPKREHISFDWSNVVDEPHRKEVVEIKSPWEDTGEIDEKELFAEMTQSTDKSRTMSFIDVLRAEKEEKERAAADKAIEYTEVLEIGQDLSAFDDAAPKLHYAPLYEDVNEPVKTPFDEPEAEKQEPVFEEEPKYEEPAKEEEPAASPEPEPEKPKVEVSRETIAQFDEYVKSFEKEAGIREDEPRFEKPLGAVSMPKFELPDFLKKDGEKSEEKPAEPDEPAKSESSDDLFEEYDIKFDDGTTEEPTFEIPSVEEAEEQPVFEEPKYEDYTDGFDFVDDDVDTGAEDLYLDMDSFRDEPSAEVKREPEVEEVDEDRPKHGAPEPEEDEEEPEVEAEEPVNEAELFKEMEESSPKHTGMTIAEPADTQSEIEALKRRLAELMGTPIDEVETEAESPQPEAEPEAPAEEEPEAELFQEPEIEEEPVIEEAPEAEPEVQVEEPEAPAEPEAELFQEHEIEEEPVIEEAPEAEPEVQAEEPEVPAEPVAEAVEEYEEYEVDYDFYLQPEVTPDVDELFEGLTAASQTQPEPVVEEAPAEEAPAEEPEVEAEPEPVVEAATVEETVAVVEETPAAEEPVVEEPEIPELRLEPEDTSDVDELFAGLMAASQPKEEPVPVVEEPAPVVEEPVAEPEPEVPVIEFEEPAPVVEEVAPVVEEVPVVEEPAPVVEEPVAEPEPEVPVIELEKPAPVVEEVAPVVEEVPVVEEPAPVVEEPVAEPEPEVPVIELEKPAPVVEEVAPVVEEVPVVEEPAPVVEEPVAEPEPEVPVIELEKPAPAVEEPAPVVEEKVSDALSLEELEKDLFGDVPTGEVEETKKIDKFYTLYKKNEEFQRLLDEEYEKLKSGGVAEEPAKAPEEKAPEAPAVEETPAEDKKAYRQVEDETIYMSKEDVEKQISQEVKPEAKPASGAVFEVKTDAAAPVELGATASKADAKAAKKAEKAARKAEKKAKSGKDDVESGNGVLTVLAVIIAIILVILLAVIIIMTVAPNSGIGTWIYEHIQNITSGISAVHMGDGQFLL